jgi:hypothetical protein
MEKLMFEEALKKLRESLGKQDVQKSNLPSSTETGDDSPIDDPASLDLGELASKAVVLFETGDLAPDLDSVREWAKTEGVTEEQAEDFSNAVIDGYFDDSSTQGTQDDITNESGEGNMGNDEIQKSLLAINENQALLAEGLNKVIEQQTKMSEMSKEIEVLKSTIAKLQVTPAPSSQKTPVMEQDVTKGASTSAAAVMSPEKMREAELIILKGIQAGDLALEEMTFFEHNRKLSENAQSYVDSKLREGK